MLFEAPSNDACNRLATFFDLLNFVRLEPVQRSWYKLPRTSIPLLGLLCAACDGQAERLVRAQLIDPESAEFSEVTTKGNVTCGLVNSKNRMGGYTGRHLFLVRYGQVFLWRDNADVDQSMLSACSTEAFGLAIQEFESQMAKKDR